MQGTFTSIGQEPDPARLFASRAPNRLRGAIIGHGRSGAPMLQIIRGWLQRRLAIESKGSKIRSWHAHRLKNLAAYLAD
jgi:hypothetical protein